MRNRPLPTVDWGRLTTHRLHARPSKVHVKDLGRPMAPNGTVHDLMASLPDQLAGRLLRRWRDAICTAVDGNRAVVAALGGHVIKTGCGPYIIDWIKRGVITAIAMNGSAAIHDVELALAGHTSEDVEARLPNGSFGMSTDTAQVFAEAADIAATNGIGLGKAIGECLQRTSCEHAPASLVYAATQAGIPCTVHVALGTDIVHMHPCADGAKTGAATMADFRLICQVVADLKGGVWMNLGSAVVMPEVFLKAISVARNLGFDLDGMTTIDLDMIRQYRARVNVLERHQCNGFAITGHHEIMLPLIHAAVLSRLENEMPAGHDANPKVIDWPRLLAIRNRARVRGKTVVWTNGCFDVLHVGHVRNLKAARAHGNLLVVGLNSDASVRQLKGPTRPIMPAEQRAEILAALDCVSHVIVFDEATAEESVARLQPDVYCKGADYAPPNGKAVPEAALVEAYGGRIEYLPLVPNTSTTDIVRRIQGHAA